MNNYDEHFSPAHYACLVVAQTNMTSSEKLLEEADYLERTANNEYYDDVEGCELLRQIAAFFRKKGK